MTRIPAPAMIITCIVVQQPAAPLVESCLAYLAPTNANFDCVQDPLLRFWYVNAPTSTAAARKGWAGDFRASAVVKQRRRDSHHALSITFCRC